MVAYISFELALNRDWQGDKVDLKLKITYFYLSVTRVDGKHGFGRLYQLTLLIAGWVCGVASLDQVLYK